MGTSARSLGHVVLRELSLVCESMKRRRAVVFHCHVSIRTVSLGSQLEIEASVSGVKLDKRHDAMSISKAPHRRLSA